MAYCAYKDKERTKLIYADEATDKDAIYYCPNNNVLHICIYVL